MPFLHNNQKATLKLQRGFLVVFQIDKTVTAYYQPSNKSYFHWN